MDPQDGTVEPMFIWLYIIQSCRRNKVVSHEALWSFRPSPVQTAWACGAEEEESCLFHHYTNLNRRKTQTTTTSAEWAACVFGTSLIVFKNESFLPVMWPVILDDVFSSTALSKEIQKKHCHCGQHTREINLSNLKWQTTAVWRCENNTK